MTTQLRSAKAEPFHELTVNGVQFMPREYRLVAGGVLLSFRPPFGAVVRLDTYRPEGFEEWGRDIWTCGRRDMKVAVSCGLSRFVKLP